MSSTIAQKPSGLIQSLYPEVTNTTPLKERSLEKSSFLKTIGVGIGTAIFSGFVADSIVTLAAKVGAIPDFNYQQMMREMCCTISKIDGFLVIACLIGPIVEELLFRHCIQEFLLTTIPKTTLKIFAPGQEKMLDSKVAKTARIVLTAAFFSRPHLMNKGSFPDAYCHSQVIAAFIGGIAYGILKESKIGLLGSTVAHISNNILACIETISYC